MPECRSNDSLVQACKQDSRSTQSAMQKHHNEVEGRARAAAPSCCRKFSRSSTQKRYQEDCIPLGAFDKLRQRIMGVQGADCVLAAGICKRASGVGAASSAEPRTHSVCVATHSTHAQIAAHTFTLVHDNQVQMEEVKRILQAGFPACVPLGQQS